LKPSVYKMENLPTIKLLKTAILKRNCLYQLIYL
jgi:hypothetical protein